MDRRTRRIGDHRADRPGNPAGVGGTPVIARRPAVTARSARRRWGRYALNRPPRLVAGVRPGDRGFFRSIAHNYPAARRAAISHARAAAWHGHSARGEAWRR